MPPQEVNEITAKIIGCTYKVSNTLGIGFVEKVYENALVHCLRETGLLVEQQYPIKLLSRGLLWVSSSRIYLSKRKYLSN